MTDSYNAEIPIANIVAGRDTQARVRMSEDAIEAYRHSYQSGDALPPIIVYHDSRSGGAFWLADGWHRVEAAKRLGWQKIAAQVVHGGQEDAVIHACGANAVNGLFRSADDKRRAVGMLLALHPDWSNRRIAEHVKVSHPFVAQVRADVTEALATGLEHDLPEVETVTTTPAAPAAAVDSDKPGVVVEHRRLTEKPPAPEPAKDMTGRPLPDGRVAAAFAKAGELRRLATTISDQIDAVEAIGKTDIGAYLNVTRTTAALENAVNAIRMATPYAVCRRCGGDGCGDCKAAGWWPRDVYNAHKAQEN